MSDRPKAKWIHKRDKYHEWWQCSNCEKRPLAPRFRQEQLTEYCPFCGSRMTAVSNGDDE